jgi:superfamily II DNA/RNA helicase
LAATEGGIVSAIPSISGSSPSGSEVRFEDLGLGPLVLKAVADSGYLIPTPIQARGIPEVLRGKDIIGIAQTGTGKTASFTLPMIEILARGRAKARMPRTLILEPTRELAAQVAESFERYGKHHKLNMALLIGGVSYEDQDKKLDRGVDVLIATPGRLLDHFERGKLMLSGVQILVIDEADRMLDMGFIPDVERIAKLIPFTRQTLFYSATMPPEISAAALHGDLDQSVRTKTLDAFRACEISILVASDVAARGLDIPSVGHIFNFDVPFHADDYVHRIGRTGRAGRTGHAFMLVNRRDEKNVAAIEKLIGTKIASRVMEGLPEEEPRRDSGKAAERGRGRGHERSRRRGGDSRPRTEHTEHRSRPEQNAVAVAAALPVMPVREERPAKARDPHQQRTVAKPRPAAATAAVPKPVDISELPAFLLRPVRLPPRRAKTPVSPD